MTYEGQTSVSDLPQPMSRPAAVAATDVLGRRCAAALIDVLVLGVVFVVLGATLGNAEASDGSASVELTGGPALLWFAIAFLYYFVSEFAAARTPGKALLGLSVVRADGAPAGAGAIAIRTVLRAVDVLPILYLAGFVSMLATGGRRQRIGDLAARTAVIAGTRSS
jgi:uncharacterized RDD family membrane protein YckC